MNKTPYNINNHKLVIISVDLVKEKEEFIKSITDSLEQNNYSFENYVLNSFNQKEIFDILNKHKDVVIFDIKNFISFEVELYKLIKQSNYKVLFLDFGVKIDTEQFVYDEVIKILPEEFEEIQQIIGDLIVQKLKFYSIHQIEIIPFEYRVIIEEFYKSKNKTLTAYDVKPLIDKSIKQIERYFENLADEFKNIIKIKQSKRKAYKLIDNFDFFIDIFKDRDDLEELVYLSKESNPELFKKFDYYFKDDDIFMFRGGIFEALQDKRYFNSLKTAIKYNEYRIIKFYKEDPKEIKPIKLVFIDNNWYIGYVENDILKLGRISFIEKVEYTTKNSYHKSSIQKHLTLLEKRLQNSMTIFDVPLKTALIKATPNISRYFKKNMKKFFNSQKFIKENSDGSVVFSIEYTQTLEILPFIQKWLPDLIILSPQELKDEYLKKLNLAITNNK